MPQQQYLSITKGRKTLLRVDETKSLLFTAGGKRKVKIGEGTVLINGKVRLPDGQELHAVLEIDEQSSGELGETYVWTPKGFCDLHSITAKERLSRTAEQIFPYQYRYSVSLNCDDHHIASDGWSHKF